MRGYDAQYLLKRDDKINMEQKKGNVPASTFCFTSLGIESASIFANWIDSFYNNTKNIDLEKFYCIKEISNKTNY